MQTILMSLFVLALAAADDRERPPALEQEPVFVSGQGGYHTYRIPSLIATRKGTVLAFCEGRKHTSGDSGDIDVLLNWVTRSQDEGATWSVPVEITRAVKRPDWTWYATGPGIGIQLRSGRLIVPCDNMTAGSKTRQSNLILSDDGGKTWRIGGVVGPQCDEAQVVELSDRRLMLNMRSYRSDHRRLVAISSDGGETFTPPVKDDALLEPVCQASILAVSEGPADILFSNPASTKRERMTVRLSTDQGKTWPAAQVLYEGPAAYSCLSALKGGSLACLYERGQRSAYETITFARFSRDWLIGQKSAAPGWKQKEFLITFWSPPPADDKALSDVAAGH